MNNKKRLGFGLYSIVLIAVVIAIAVVINLIVSSLPTNVTKLETSNLGLYTLSPETEEIVRAVDCDVTLYILANSSSEDLFLREFLNRYNAINGKIKVKNLDAVAHPMLTTESGDQIDLTSIEQNSVIAVSELRSKTVNLSEIYQTRYESQEDYYAAMMGYGGGTSYFDGENCITGALEYVSMKSLVKLYTLTGNGELALGSRISGYLSDDNFEVDELDLMKTGAVPEDADAIIINCPESDLSENETDLISSYLKDGGNLVIISSFMPDGSFERLYSIGEGFGITAKNSLVCEDSQGFYYQNPYYLIPSYGSHSITSGMSNSHTCMPQAHPLFIDTSSLEGVTAASLLKTSDKAYLKAQITDTVERESGDEQGEYTIAAISSAEIDEGVNSNLVWFSSYAATNDEIDSFFSGGNSSLLLASLSEICEKGSSVSIAAKSMKTASLVVTEENVNFWGIVMIAIIPLAFIAIGVIVWYKRKKR